VLTLLWSSVIIAAWEVSLGYASLVGRFVLGFVFLLASISKLVAPDDFSRAVANYRLLPFRWGRALAVWLPRLELAVALCLLSGALLPLAAATAAVLLLGFATAVGINLARGRRIECGCGGFASPRTIGPGFLLRNLLLAAGAVLAAASPVAALTVPWVSLATAASVPTQDALAIVLASACAVALASVTSEARRMYQAQRTLFRMLPR
jgi:uncharacterized membrane protein YphA (DoxX/SURF4 family)